jgi:hypothetical protein
MMSRRLVLIVAILFFAIPPMLAYGWTRYRYSQGTVYPGVLPRVTAWTSGFTDRQYNSAYRSPDVCEAWGFLTPNFPTLSPRRRIICRVPARHSRTRPAA